MGDPDWNRVLVGASGAATKVVPLGDPTRWGAQTSTFLEAPGGLDVFSEQFIQVATRDGYSRSWAIVGTVQLPVVVWNSVGAYPAGLISVGVVLEITMGVGQLQLTHQIILAWGALATVGLCTTQNAINGGPYQSIFSSGATIETRPFAAIGALIGHSITARVRYITPGSPAGFPMTAVVQALVTPFAPGQGL